MAHRTQAGPLIFGAVVTLQPVAQTVEAGKEDALGNIGLVALVADVPSEFGGDDAPGLMGGRFGASSTRFKGDGISVEILTDRVIYRTADVNGTTSDPVGATECPRTFKTSIHEKKCAFASPGGVCPMVTGPFHSNSCLSNKFNKLCCVNFEDEAEKVQHESAMEALSEQFPEKEDLVRDLYRRKLQELIPEATIRTFISIFVTREIKRTLMRRKGHVH